MFHMALGSSCDARFQAEVLTAFLSSPPSSRISIYAAPMDTLQIVVVYMCVVSPSLIVESGAFWRGRLGSSFPRTHQACPSLAESPLAPETAYTLIM